MESYKPLFLTDEKMAIDKFGEACGQPFLSSQTRSQYREHFRKELAAGIDNMRIHFYGKVLEGTKHPHCLFIWKVPTVHGPQHEGQVAMTVDVCREMLPKEMKQEAVRHFNRIMTNISDIPAPARDALRNYLFVGEPDPDGSIADEYVQFVLDMAAGQVCSKIFSLVVCLYFPYYKCFFYSNCVYLFKFLFYHLLVYTTANRCVNVS